MSSRDPNFPRAPIAAREGLHAAFGFPVMLRGEVLSVMEFFSLEIRPPDDELLSMLVERRQSDRAVLRSPAGAGRARSILHALARHAVRCRLRRLFQTGQSGVAAGARLHRGGAAGAAVHRVHPPRRSRGHDGRGGKAARPGRGPLLRESLLHKDGTLRWLLWTATPFPSSRSSTRRRMTSPSARPAKKRSPLRARSGSQVIARSRTRPRDWRSWSRSWNLASAAPRRRPRPRAPFSPT